MALLMSDEQVRPYPRNVADTRSTYGRRIRSIEDGMLGMGHFEAAANFDAPTSEIHSAMTAARAFRDDSKSFVNLSIYEQRLHRSLKEALRQLRELQTERRELYKAEMDNAIRLLNAQQMKGLPYEPEASAVGIGVVHVSTEAARRDRLDDSLLAEKSNFNLAKYTCTAGDLVTGAFPNPEHLHQPLAA
jgi:hypothetical protein